MAVNARAKGARGETAVKELLIKYTGQPFERVPNSGALPYLKGDLYIPHCKNRFCIEVKNYAESPLNATVFTSKTNNLVQWWLKICQQAKDNGMEPLLFFKWDRSKIYVGTSIFPDACEKFLYISWLDCYIMMAEEWLGKEKLTWQQ